MNNANKITNIVIAGLGGQGVLSAANILAQAPALKTVRHEPLSHKLL